MEEQGSQAYSGKADWNYIKELADQSPLSIVGNGDLISGEQAHSALKWSACFAVMIGRGCLNDPWIFLSAREYYKKEQEEGLVPSNGEIYTENSSFISKQKSQDKMGGSLYQKESQDKPAAIFKKQAFNNTLNEKTRDYNQAINTLRGHLENFYQERLFLLQLKKFAVWFSAGFPHSADFRKNLFQEKDKSIVIKKIEDFFDKNRDFQKPPPSYEPFLMQGHG